MIHADAEHLDALIRRLSDLMEEKGLAEIELGDADGHLRVSRNGHGAVIHAPMAAAPAAPAAAAPAAAPTAAHPGAVTAPMVGTCYLQPEPGAPSFVSVGDQVKEGQTLCIIEAMKVMNQIKASRAGRVAQIIITDAQPVEYGEVLLILE